jgi:hypothetical protein
LLGYVRHVEIGSLFFCGSYRVAYNDSRVVGAAIEVVLEEKVAGDRRIVLGLESDRLLSNVVAAVEVVSPE